MCYWHFILVRVLLAVADDAPAGSKFPLFIGRRCNGCHMYVSRVHWRVSVLTRAYVWISTLRRICETFRKQLDSLSQLGSGRYWTC